MFQRPVEPSQLRARKVYRALARHGLVGPMGQVGSAGDKAAMEPFFALLQRNVLVRRRWTSRDELRIASVTWIERTYRRRRQAALGRLTPVPSGRGRPWGSMTPQSTPPFDRGKLKCPSSAVPGSTRRTDMPGRSSMSLRKNGRCCRRPARIMS